MATSNPNGCPWFDPANVLRAPSPTGYFWGVPKGKARPCNLDSFQIGEHHILKMF